MFRVKIDSKSTGKRLENLTRRVSRLEVPFRKFGSYWINETEKQFDSQTDPSGKPWAALKPATLEQKRRLGYPDDILTRTGALRKSLGFSAKGKSLEVYSDSEYGQFHQYGTSKMPKREIVGMNDKRQQMLIKIIKSYVMK